MESKNKQRWLTWLWAAVAVAAWANPALAGDVGGQVYSSPGTITLRLEWGSAYQYAKEIDKTGDGAYAFGVNIRNNTKYRVIGKAAPAGWGCKGKQGDVYLNRAAAAATNVYCGTASSADGIRVATWNLEWFDSADPVEKKQAVAALINQYNFDVLVANEVLDAASWEDFIANYLGNAADWDYRITQSGCSLHEVTMWRKSGVTLESGYELDRANSGGFIDETGTVWDDCAGRRPYVANFAINGSTVKFTTASIHFKAKTSPSDCQLRKDQVDSFVQWVDWAAMGAGNFIALGDYNDQLPGNGNCNSVDTLTAMETHPGFVFATAQPGYDYALMMGDGLVTYDTASYQNTIDQFWISSAVLDRLGVVDTYGNGANAVQANMYFSPWGEPDHNPPYIVIRK